MPAIGQALQMGQDYMCFIYVSYSLLLKIQFGIYYSHFMDEEIKM